MLGEKRTERFAKSLAIHMADKSTHHDCVFVGGKKSPLLLEQLENAIQNELWIYETCFFFQFKIYTSFLNMFKGFDKRKLITNTTVFWHKYH